MTHKTNLEKVEINLRIKIQVILKAHMICI